MDFEWDSVRNGGILPLNESSLDDSEDKRSEFLGGLELLRLHGPRAKSTAKVLPQMLRLADMLNAGRRFNGILEPRRSSKTTGLFALALGRIRSREDYQVVYTMTTTGLKTRQRYKKDVREPLERLWPDKNNRPFTLNNAGGSESVTWNETGSTLAFVSPKGDSFRSDAWDLIIVDEAGEAEVEETEDIIAAALATQNTRPEPQLIAAGTAGEYRDGNLLWDTLEKGRTGQYGILEYAAKPGTTVEDIETWAQAAALLSEVHPGVDTLTTLEVLEGDYDFLGPAKRTQFLAEYLSIFGTGANASGILNVRQFAAGKIEGEPPAEPPADMVLGVQVHKTQRTACVVAVWREDDLPRVVVLEHRPGVRWLQKRVLELARRYKVPIAHDTVGPVVAEAEALARVAPRPRLYPQKTANAMSAASLLVKEVEAGRVGHWDDPVLNAAVAAARKRAIGYAGWAFGAPDEEDIIVVEAASLALRLYDELGKRSSFKPYAA